MKLFRRLKKEDEAWSPARAPVAAPRGENEGRTGDAKPLGGAGRAGGLFQLARESTHDFLYRMKAALGSLEDENEAQKTSSVRRRTSQGASEESVNVASRAGASHWGPRSSPGREYSADSYTDAASVTQADAATGDPDQHDGEESPGEGSGKALEGLVSLLRTRSAQLHEKHVLRGAEGAAGGVGGGHGDVAPDRAQLHAEGQGGSNEGGLSNSGAQGSSGRPRSRRVGAGGINAPRGAGSSGATSEPPPGMERIFSQPGVDTADFDQQMEEFERIAMRVAERPEPPEWRRERLQRFRSSGNADSSWQSGSGQRGRPREAGDEGGRPRGSSEVQGSWGGDPDAAVALSRLSLDARQVLGRALKASLTSGIGDGPRGRGGAEAATDSAVGERGKGVRKASDISRSASRAPAPSARASEAPVRSTFSLRSAAGGSGRHAGAGLAEGQTEGLRGDGGGRDGGGTPATPQTKHREVGDTPPVHAAVSGTPGYPPGSQGGWASDGGATPSVAGGVAISDAGSATRPARGEGVMGGRERERRMGGGAAEGTPESLQVSMGGKAKSQASASMGSRQADSLRGWASTADGPGSAGARATGLTAAGAGGGGGGGGGGGTQGLVMGSTHDSVAGEGSGASPTAEEARKLVAEVRALMRRLEEVAPRFASSRGAADGGGAEIEGEEQARLVAQLEAAKEALGTVSVRQHVGGSGAAGAGAAGGCDVMSAIAAARGAIGVAGDAAGAVSGTRPSPVVGTAGLVGPRATPDVALSRPAASTPYATPDVTLDVTPGIIPHAPPNVTRDAALDVTPPPPPLPSALAGSLGGATGGFNDSVGAAELVPPPPVPSDALLRTGSTAVGSEEESQLSACATSEGEGGGRVGQGVGEGGSDGDEGVNDQSILPPIPIPEKLLLDSARGIQPRLLGADRVDRREGQLGAKEGAAMGRGGRASIERAGEGRAVHASTAATADARDDRSGGIGLTDPAAKKSTSNVALPTAGVGAVGSGQPGAGEGAPAAQTPGAVRHSLLHLREISRAAWSRRAVAGAVTDGTGASASAGAADGVAAQPAVSGADRGDGYGADAAAADADTDAGVDAGASAAGQASASQNGAASAAIPASATRAVAAEGGGQHDSAMHSGDPPTRAGPKQAWVVGQGEVQEQKTKGSLPSMDYESATSRHPTPEPRGGPNDGARGNNRGGDSGDGGGDDQGRSQPPLRRPSLRDRLLRTPLGRARMSQGVATATEAAGAAGDGDGAVTGAHGGATEGGVGGRAVGSGDVGEEGGAGAVRRDLRSAWGEEGEGEGHGVGNDSAVNDGVGNDGDHGDMATPQEGISEAEGGDDGGADGNVGEVAGVGGAGGVRGVGRSMRPTSPITPGLERLRQLGMRKRSMRESRLGAAGPGGGGGGGGQGGDGGGWSAGEGVGEGRRAGGKGQGRGGRGAEGVDELAGQEAATPAPRGSGGADNGGAGGGGGEPASATPKPFLRRSSQRALTTHRKINWEDVQPRTSSHIDPSLVPRKKPEPGRTPSGKASASRPQWGAANSDYYSIPRKGVSGRAALSPYNVLRGPGAKGAEGLDSPGQSQRYFYVEDLDTAGPPRVKRDEDRHRRQQAPFVRAQREAEARRGSQGRGGARAGRGAGASHGDGVDDGGAGVAGGVADDIHGPFDDIRANIGELLADLTSLLGKGA